MYRLILIESLRHRVKKKMSILRNKSFTPNKKWDCKVYLNSYGEKVVKVNNANLSLAMLDMYIIHGLYNDIPYTLQY